MQNTRIKKEKRFSRETSKKMARKTRFDLLALLVKKSFYPWLADFYPWVDVVRLDGFRILNIWKGYLYLNIGSKVQGVKTDNWEMFSCVNNIESLSLLIKFKEIKSLLDEIIANKADYYVDYYNDLRGNRVHAGIEQFLREASDLEIIK